MSNRGWLRGGVAVALGAIAVAGCGGGGTKPVAKSALDPASVVPANSVLYVSASVRPKGTLQQDLSRVIDQIGGPNTVAELNSELGKHASSGFGRRWSQVKPWLGQRIGAAVIGLPPGQFSEQAVLDYAVLILPTTDPSAAKTYIASHIKKSAALIYKIVGNYALIGGPYAVQMAATTAAKASLADSSAYSSLLTRVGQGAFATFYDRPYPILKLETKLFSTEASPPAALAEIKSGLSKISPNAASLVTLDVTSNTLRLESTSVGAKSQAGSTAISVGHLPAASWLAVALSGGLSGSSTLKSIESSIDVASKEEATSGAENAGLKFVINDVLPALGPMSLSIAGQTKATVKVGFALTPGSQSAGDKLLSAVQRMLGKGAAQVKLGHDGNQLVATYGYKSFGELLAPQATLSSNPAFRQALGQLPAGSSAELFVNFGPIAALAALDHSSNDARAVKAVGHLSYLIAGSGKHSFELVLGVK